MNNPLVENILLFNRFSKYHADMIYDVIKDETAQTTAVILARLDSKKSKEILELFPGDDQKEIVFRIASVKQIPPEFLNEVANVIGEKLRLLESEDSRAGLDGQQKMAEILKHMSSSKSKDLLDKIEKKDMGLADRVKRKIFIFEDITNVEDRGLQHALTKVDVDTLALALKGAPDEIKTAVWNALSERRQKSLRKEMKHIGPRLKSDVENARSDILTILRDYADQGILRLKSDPSSEEWV